MLNYCVTIQDIIKVSYKKIHMFIFDVKRFKVVARGPNLSVRMDQCGFVLK